MRKVIITREHPISRELQIELLENSFLPFHRPLIHCIPHDLPKMIVRNLNKADWIFFTSAVAFEFFYPHMSDKIKIATVGPATSQSIRKKGLVIDFEASRHYARDFVEEWLSMGLSKQTILLPQSVLSNKDIAQLLSNKGHEVFTWSLYSTELYGEGLKHIPSLLKESDLIWTFASPSAWKSFITGGGIVSRRQEIAVIGKSTGKAVVESGYKVTYMPEEPSIEKMIHEIIHQNRIASDEFK